MMNLKNLRQTRPLRWADFKVAAFDMDSTLINIECVDEIAAAAGKKAEVSAITEAAMRGEIADYKASLRQRVALLKGVHTDQLEQVLRERLKFNPGAHRLVKALKDRGLVTVLVSGGFTWFTDHVQKELSIDRVRANVLDIENNRLTGRLVDQAWGDICDGEEKRKMLLSVCQDLGCSPQAAMAIGDGANDLPMMGVAGLSVAFHAKPTVQAQAMVSIEAGGLDQLLSIFED